MERSKDHIFKAKLKLPYFFYYNETAQDIELTMQAKGLLAYLLSLPEEWKIIAKEIPNHFPNGRDAVYKALNELIEKAYIVKGERREDGKFSGYHYKVFPVKYERAVEMGIIHDDDQIKPVDPKTEEDKPEEKIPYKEIIEYLNTKADKKFKPSSKANKDKIRARWNEGWRTDNFKKVIDNKVIQWANDPKMAEYLRPETLFGTKFESYLNTKPTKPKGNGPSFPPAGSQPQRSDDDFVPMTEEERMAKLKEAGLI